MHSRSYLLLNRELIKLRQEPLWGIDVNPLDEANLLDWDITMQGLQSSIWEGGIFKLLVRFSPQYNEKPPEVNFFTIPFHPNVDMSTGRPCIDFLDDSTLWNPNYCMSYILLTIQDMLSSPSTENAVNAEASNAYELTPAMYRQMVFDCVTASKRIAAGLPPHEEEEEVEERGKEPASDVSARTKTKLIHKVSYDDYLAVWNGIATTRPARDAPNPLIGQLQKDRHFKSVHIDSSDRVIKDVRKQLQGHHQLIYGVGTVNKDFKVDPKSVLFSRLKSLHEMNEKGEDKMRPGTGDDELLEMLTWTQNIDPEEDVEALMELQQQHSELPPISSAVNEREIELE